MPANFQEISANYAAQIADKGMINGLLLVASF